MIIKCELCIDDKDYKIIQKYAKQCKTSEDIIIKMFLTYGIEDALMRDRPIDVQTRFSGNIKAK